MAEVSQGQVYRNDFGLEGGVELADKRFALVVSRDDYNPREFQRSGGAHDQ